MRKFLLALLAATAVLGTPAMLEAQTNAASTVIKNITTSGADCSVATSCANFSMTGSATIGIDLRITGSGTFQFEATTDSTISLSNPAIYRAIVDDVSAVNNATSSGFYFFTNSGYARIRLRASALSGSAVVVAIQGGGPLRTTASVTVGGANNTLVDGVTASIKATVKNFTNSNPLATMIVDSAGTQITSFGGGAQNLNASAQATPTGTVSLGWDGANVRALNTNASGSLNVIFPSAQAVTQSGAFTVGQTGTWNITNVSGTVSLPTGASTAAKQPALGTAGAASADVITVQGIASMTALKVDGSAVTQPATGTKTNNNAAPGATNVGVLGGLANAATPSWAEGNLVTFSTDLHGSQRVVQLDSSGAAVPVADGGSGASTGNTTRIIPSTDSLFAAIPTAATTGGASNYSTLQTSGAVFTAQIKGSAGQVYDLDCSNTSAAAAFVRIYNQTGAPASTDGANIIWRGTIPGSTTGGGFVKDFNIGRVMGTGIGIRISAAIADNDTTVLTANTVMCNVGYK